MSPLGSPVLGDSSAPLNQITDNGQKLCGGVTTATQLTATDTPCTLLEIQAYEGNTQVIAVGGSGVKSGTAAAYTDRIGVVLAPGQSKIICTPNANLWYISGLATDWVTWTVYKGG
jgi:hypothetical protein